MNKRYLIGGLIILVFVVVAFFSFIENKIEYSNFTAASEKNKKCQVKGVWNKEKESGYDTKTNQFTFFMKDENNKEMKVIYDGATPNNFELASHIVVTGKIDKDYFHASEILTKCPSKYEGQGDDVKNSGL